MNCELTCDIIRVMTLFPAFFDRPPRIKLAYQEDNEHINLLLRQHWFTNIGWVAAAFLAAISPVLLIGMRLFSIELPFLIPGDVMFTMLVVWYLLIFAYAIEKFLFWYFNIYVATDHRLIDVVSHTLMSRDITEAHLIDVQSVKSQVRGIFGSLFNFGDVIIETAAKKQNIEFLAVPRPDFVSDRIQDLRRELVRGEDNEP